MYHYRSLTTAFSRC